MPDFLYFLADETHPVNENEADGHHTNKASTRVSLNEPLPQKPDCNTIHTGITYGDYFNKAKDFISRNNFSNIRKALSAHLDHEPEPHEITMVKIFLEKHGELYHPARLHIIYKDKTYQFVLNLAFSEAARSIIKREFGLLKKLHDHNEFIPRVYVYDQDVQPASITAAMILGEWFDGFSEFHVTEPEKGRKLIGPVVLWDAQKGRIILKEKEAFDIYRNAAKILAYYYDIGTSEEISPWHHAAGDFVAKQTDTGIDVRLITIRGYQSRTTHSPENEDDIFLGIIRFFIVMTLKMRIDRIDGTGKSVFLDGFVLKAAVKGFFDGLMLRSPELSAILRQHLTSINDKMIKILLNEYVSTLPKHLADFRLTAAHADAHAKAVQKALR